MDPVNSHKTIIYCIAIKANLHYLLLGNTFRISANKLERNCESKKERLIIIL